MKLIIYLIFIVFYFVSCQSLRPVGNEKALVDTKKKSSVSVKKVWIRETSVKNLARPSILQSIQPVMTTSGLLIQGNKTTGVGAYTLNQGKKKWYFPLKGGLAGNVLVSNDRVFFGGANGILYSLELKTGKMIWKRHIGLTSMSAPVIHKNYLYLASPDRLYCLNIKTGDNVWTYSTQVKSVEFTVEGVASPLIGKSLIYFKVSDDTLIALDFKGRLKWKKTLSPFRQPLHFRHIQSGYGEGVFVCSRFLNQDYIV